MSSNKRKEKTTLSNQQRKDIIAFKEKNSNISNVDLVDLVKKNMGLDVHPSTIGCLIKNKDNIGDNLSAKSLEPDTILATKHLKERKKNKERLTVAFCANADRTDKIILLLKAFDLKMAGRKTLLLIDGILPINPDNDSEDKDDDEVLDIDDIELIKELQELEIHEALSDQEIVDLAANSELEEDKSDKDNDNTEMRQITHNEALNAIDLLEQYLLQQEFCDTARLKHDKALSSLQKAIRKL
ncbi:16064_t:CDS:2 [Dentiscutata erythropus]|uniref:16064_t:CDS:1 n=1 Tax=Dentiscutata erythropus TaxID=1348616 RepID=A0A9N9JMZ3_9GLOM|nr:16064_t:CDS:2 [Dentiscutata erythropus]